MSAALEQHDVLVSPVSPTAAFRIGERSADPLAMYKGDLMTVPINLAGAGATRQGPFERDVCCAGSPLRIGAFSKDIADWYVEQALDTLFARCAGARIVA